MPAKSPSFSSLRFTPSNFASAASEVSGATPTCLRRRPAASAFSRLWVPSSDHSAAPTGAPSCATVKREPRCVHTRPSNAPEAPPRALKVSTGVQNRLEQAIDVRVAAVRHDETVAWHRAQQLVELPEDRFDVRDRCPRGRTRCC